MSAVIFGILDYRFEEESHGFVVAVSFQRFDSLRLIVDALYQEAGQNQPHLITILSGYRVKYTVNLVASRKPMRRYSA